MFCYVGVIISDWLLNDDDTDRRSVCTLTGSFGLMSKYYVMKALWDYPLRLPSYASDLRLFEIIYQYLICFNLTVKAEHIESPDVTSLSSIIHI